ncbi:Glycosyltransferase AglD [uncultured archaeon]|nr:Glycosyltransferase AglD [uncultured archaeon]
MADVAWTIVVPVLNEGSTLGRLLERLYLLPEIQRCEVLVVDGGSTDHTRDVFIEAVRIHPRLFLLDVPSGKGLALRRAFARALGRFIAFLDGDLQYAPSDLPKLMRRVERGADLAVSRRRVAWADHSVRRLASRAFVHLGRGMLGLPVSDPQSGMKALRASLLPKLHLTANDWGMDVQLIRQAQAGGARIEEVEIDFHPRGGGASKTGLVSTSLDLLGTALEEKAKSGGEIPASAVKSRSRPRPAKTRAALPRGRKKPLRKPARRR